MCKSAAVAAAVRMRLSSHLSPAFHTRPPSITITTPVDTTTLAISRNYICRHFHTRAFSHRSLFFPFFSAYCKIVSAFIQSTQKAVCLAVFCSHRVFKRCVRHESSRCLVSILVCQISMSNTHTKYMYKYMYACSIIQQIIV